MRTIATAITLALAAATATVATACQPPQEGLQQQCKTHPRTGLVSITRPGPSEVKAKDVKFVIEGCLHGYTLWALESLNGSEHYRIAGKIGSKKGYTKFTWSPTVPLATTGYRIEFAFYLAGPICEATLSTHKVVTLTDISQGTLCPSPVLRVVSVKKG